MSESAAIAGTAVTSVLIITSIVGNSLVCAVIKKNRDMRSPMNYLLINLAVADIIYAIFNIPYMVLTHSSIQPNGATGKLLYTFGTFAWVGAASSVFTLVTVAVERYWSVVHPYGGSRKRLTTRKLRVLLPGFWLFALIVEIPIVMFVVCGEKIDSQFCIRVWSHEKDIRLAFLSTLLALVVISTTVMIVLYFRVVYILWFRKNNDVNLSHQKRGVLKVRKRVTLMVISVSVIFGITWLPDSILHIVVKTTSIEISPFIFSILHTMIMFNSAVNPFVYALINQRFKEKIKSMLFPGSTSLVSKNSSDSDTQSIELANRNIQPTAKVTSG